MTLQQCFENLQEVECFLYYEANKTGDLATEAAHEAVKEALIVFYNNLMKGKESNERN